VGQHHCRDCLQRNKRTHKRTNKQASECTLTHTHTSAGAGNQFAVAILQKMERFAMIIDQRQRQRLAFFGMEKKVQKQ